MSLSARYIWVLVLLLGGLGVAIAATARYASELYFHEVNQTLNQSLAMYVVERLPLFADSEVNTEAFMSLAEQAMVVNPSAEVYLLDPDGNILAHALPEGVVLDRHVALAPVQAFLERSDNTLVLGDDPRSDKAKSFSAFPVDVNGERQGYLYVILGGALFEAAQDAFYGSFLTRLIGLVVLVTLIAGGVLGFVLLQRVSQPLQALQKAVGQYAKSGFLDDTAIRDVPEHVSEIEALKREIRALTDKLALQFDQLKTNDRLRRELIANFSHDLRTPLASMQGYVETLLIKGENLDASERRQMLTVAHKHTHQLNRMVGDLFELAKLDSGAQACELEAFSLAELLQDIVQEFELTARERNIRLQLIGCSPANDNRVHADISLIQRVFENLLSNAIRHTPEGGHIEVALAPTAGAIEVLVRDSGCGIDSTLLESIFERHVGSGKHAQSGLGLAIVKRILELHGSAIEVTSRIDEGTCFSFELARAA